MISNSLGAMPRQTAGNLAAYAEMWATRGVRAWEERWWEMPIEVGNRVARVIGAPAGSVSMHENVTTSIRTDRVLEAIDGTTAVIAFSHVLFRTSYIMDAAAIAMRAREVGASVILDTYQSAGIVPVDVTALDVDFAVGGCLKWLCGGPGNAFLYTRPEARKRIRPAFTGWLSHRNPFAFDIDPLEERDVREDAMGMMNGTPSIPAYYAALAGLDIIDRVGVERIRAKSIELTGRLLALVDDLGFTSAASRDPRRLAGTVAVNVPDALQVARTLKARDFVVDYRPPVGVRLSPHFYNTIEEVERVMAEIASIVEKKDYADSLPKSLVT